jgi:hypothetical protein
MLPPEWRASRSGSVTKRGQFWLPPRRFCPFRPFLAVFGGLSGVGFCLDPA